MPHERDRKGSVSLPKVYDRDAGVWEKYDGHAGHSRLETVFGAVTSAGSALFTLSSTQRAYITYMHVQPRNAGITAGTFHLVASGATAATLLIARLMPQPNTLNVTATQDITRIVRAVYERGDGVKPFIEVAAGKTLVAKGRPNGIPQSVTISFYRVSTTGDK
jgi:hypothetical protein